MYKIKHFGALNHDKQIQSLKAFQGENDEMLFPYNVPGLVGYTPEEKEWFVEEVIEVIWEGYVKETLWIYNHTQLAIDKKISKIICDYLKNKIELENESFKELMGSVKQGNLQKFDKQTAHDIKYAICYELLVNNYDPKEYEVMKKRKVFENKIWFGEEGECEEKEIIWWYSLEDEKEIWTQIIRVCGANIIIADKNKPFEFYRYALVYIETAEDYDLLIYAQNDGEFEEIVVPKIAEINQDVIKNIEKY